jgi:hypothetical protein
MKIKRSTFKHIEEELKAYHDTLRNIDVLRRDIILAGMQQVEERGSGSAAGSLVERRATRLADSMLINEMHKITETIAVIYEQFHEGVKAVLWIRYGLTIGWQPPDHLIKRLNGRNKFSIDVKEQARILGIDESTLHRYKKAFIYQIAERLGWY